MMEVILRDDVRSVGKAGELVKVKPGYARNYLLPQGLAMRSSNGAEQQASVMRKSREVKDARDRAVAEDVAKTLAPMVVTVEARMISNLHDEQAERALAMAAAIKELQAA